MNNAAFRYGIWISIVLLFTFLGTSLLWVEGSNQHLSVWLGYIGLFVSMILLVLGILHKRNKEQGGKITFGQAFRTGATITLAAGILFFFMNWAFFEIRGDAWLKKYYAHQVELIRSGAPSPEAAGSRLQQFEEEWKQSGERYKNSAFQAGVVFFTLVPAGFVVSLVGAWLLKRT